MTQRRKSNASPIPDSVERVLGPSLQRERVPPLRVDERQVDRLARLMETPARRPVLVGPSECGKTALVHALASRFAQQRGAKRRDIWQISLRAIDARDTQHVGVGLILAETILTAASHPHRPIVFVRDLRNLYVFPTAAAALADVLTQTDVGFIGEAREDFHALLLDDPELSHELYIVRMKPWSSKRTREVMRACGNDLESSLSMKIENNAVDRAMLHHEQLLGSRARPGAPLSVMVDATMGAYARGQSVVTAADVSRDVADRLGLDPHFVDPTAEWPKKSKSIDSTPTLHPTAHEALRARLQLFRQGLTARDRPMGVVLLVGPSGAGKATVVRQTCENALGTQRPLVRIPLLEYVEDWRVEQLFGQRSAPVLDIRRGVLTRMLAPRAVSIVMLEDIDKANAIVQRHLVQVLARGEFTNAADEVVDAHNVLFVLTTTAGTELFRENTVGFTSNPHAETLEKSVLKRVQDMIPSEILDQVDATVVCPPMQTKDRVEFVRRVLVARHTEPDRAMEDRVASLNFGDATVRGVQRRIEDDVYLRSKRTNEHATPLAPRARGKSGASSS